MQSYSYWPNEMGAVPFKVYDAEDVDKKLAALTAENERLKSDHACGDCPMLNGVVSENNKICQTVDKLRIENQRLMEALVDIHDYWNRDSNDKAMYDACNHAIDVAYNALKQTDPKESDDAWKLGLMLHQNKQTEGGG
jgi:hypothetical protein